MSNHTTRSEVEERMFGCGREEVGVGDAAEKSRI
jgi:hypothetical protein